MIAITGASGQLGRLVITEMLKSVPAATLIAVVRNPDKVADLATLGVQVRTADYDQPETLTPAFTGVDKLLLISANEVGRRAPQHAAVIEAARKTGVGFMAYTSILHAATSPLPLAAEHRETEAMLATSGIPYALLRNGWYTENYAASVPTALLYGAVFGCAGDGRIASAARADYAAAAAAVMLADAQADKVYELAGDTAYTLTEFAAEIARQSGKTVTYQNMSEADYAKALRGAGLPEGLASMLAESDTGASQGGLFDDSLALSKLIGRPTAPLTEVIQAALNA